MAKAGAGEKGHGLPAVVEGLSVKQLQTLIFEVEDPAEFGDLDVYNSKAKGLNHLAESVATKVTTVAKLEKVAAKIVSGQLKHDEAVSASEKPKTKKGGAQPGSGRPRAATFDGKLKIKVLMKENPKREGTKAHQLFAAYKNGMTVAQYEAAVGTQAQAALRWDSDPARGYITVG